MRKEQRKKRRGRPGSGLGGVSMSNEERGMGSIYIEESIVGGVKGLLLGRVNELLGEAEFAVPLVEFGRYRGGDVVVPVVGLSTGERMEKERIVRAEVYSLTIGFVVPDMPEGERRCYAYAAAVATALGEDPTLDGVADRAEMTGKRYDPPKQPGAGGNWELALSLRITIEGTGL
jgi:hypothetical protein